MVSPQNRLPRLWPDLVEGDPAGEVVSDELPDRRTLPYKCSNPFCTNRVLVPAEPCTACWIQQNSERIVQREKQRRTEWK